MERNEILKALDKIAGDVAQVRHDVVMRGEIDKELLEIAQADMVKLIAECPREVNAIFVSQKN